MPSLIDKVKKNGFLLNETPTQLIKNEYRSVLPEEILQIWDELGFGSFLNGYLKIVNPNNFRGTLKKGFELYDDKSSVLFATAMGDLLVLHNDFLYFLDFRHGNFEVIAKNMKFFFQDIFDENYLAEELKWEHFLTAKEKLGDLAFDECFGYEPLLVAGGVEKVSNLRKVKLIEHINLITQFAGAI
jgi:hypothetical protein